VQSSGALQLYVDGNLESSAVGSTNSLNAASALRFGAIQSGGGFFNGQLDEIKIYDRALGNLEIAALYDDATLPPGAPSNVTAASANAAVTLNWWEVPVATSYAIGRSLNSGGPYTMIANVTSPTYTDTNVVNGTSYYYVIEAVDSAGAGSNSAEVSAFPFEVAAWFAADTITGLSSGASVSNWMDLSGMANNATQAASQNQPLFVTGAMNGLPVVRFNSAGSNYLSFPRPVQDDFTIFIVFQSIQTNQGTGTAFFNGAGLVNGDQPNAQNDFGTQLNANGKIVAGTGNPDTSISSGSSFNDGHPHLAVFERTESTGALALYVDGAAVATGTGNANSLTAPSVLDLGAVPSGGGYFTGDIAEVKIYDTALSSSERAATQDAMAAKWGIFNLSAPSEVSAAPGNGAVVLNWSAASFATGYVVQRSTNNGGPFTIVAAPAATSFTDTNVANGVTYFYVVAASNALGQSANSREVYVTPSAAGAMVAWFRADAIPGVSSGGAVSLWPDLSGNGNNASQSVSANQPTFVTGAMNGLPVVRFTSSKSTSLSLPRPVQDDFTIVCVFQSTQGLNTGNQFYQGAGLVNAEVAGSTNDFGTSLNASGHILAGTGNPDTTVTSIAGYNDGNPHVFTFTRVRSTGSITLYVDGAQAGVTTAGMQSLTSPTNVVLGAQRTSLYYLSGDISEVQIYGSALSATARQTLETALRVKYLGLARPALSTPVLSANSLTLAWPAIPGFTLYSATNLASPVTWLPVNNVVFSSNGTNSVSLLPSNAPIFFQLMNP
jgi:hypothetical protein